ncbi:MAG: DUF4339 domain-containing protein [Bdellovibrionales bacterium]|nr:DUF4339 domain-containing protein [Bdellovibrionales bacterium]
MEEKGFIYRTNKHYGPLCFDEIKDLISQGLISTRHYFWQPGMNEWTKIGEIESFRAYANIADKDLTDDEFESKLRLDLRFINRNKPIFLEDIKVENINKALNNNVESNSTDVSEPLSTPWWKLLFEEFKANRNFQIGSALLFVFIIAVSLFGSKKPSYSFPELNSKDMKYLESAPGKSLLFSGPKLHLLLKSSGSARPIIFIGTNIEVGETLLLKLTGIPETLIGAHTVNFQIKKQLTDNIIKVEELFLTNGKPLPQGEYKIDVSCISCTFDKKNIFSNQMFNGVSPQDVNYLSQLNVYHAELRESANTELIELTQIIEALESQLKSAITNYRKLYGYRWTQYSKEWMGLQKPIMDAFQELDNPEFFNKLYYNQLYMNMREIGQRLVELNQYQNSEDKKNDVIKDYYKAIEEKISSTRKKLDHMKSQFINSSGMPPRKEM